MIHLKHTDDYDNWHFGGPTNGVRSRLATAQFLELLPANNKLRTVIGAPSVAQTHHLERAVELGVHSFAHVAGVLRGYSDEWEGCRPDLGTLAVQMFNGTAELADAVLPGELGVHWQGAKHHAMFDHSSGFCVLNDMAYVALEMAFRGHTVFYLDWDAHHGDGVEELTYTSRRITTVSIHENGIFPGTGLVDHPRDNVYNRALPAYSGNKVLVETVQRAIEIMASDTTVILLAAGADGHRLDPLSTLQYTVKGYEEAATILGEAARGLNARVIMGGAGGYRPTGVTPKVWARTAAALARAMNG